MVKAELKIKHHNDGKLKALEDAILQIEKKFGKGSVLCLGKADSCLDIEVIPSGSLGLDLALGVGGIPRGRITEIFGPESSGKSTLAFHVVAEAQKAGGTALYIDVEHALDPLYARACGIKVEDLLISQPDHGEQALEIAEAVVRSGAVDVVVIDSVAALVPQAEIEGEMGEAHVGLQARLMSQALRKLCGIISANRTAVIFINQLREKVGVMYGSPEVTPGGRALKFYATVRIDLRVKESIGDKNNRIGNLVGAKVIKNKVAPPFRYAGFEVIYGHGISREGELLDLGQELEIVTRSGAHYQWNQQALGHGREAARKYLQEHPEVARQIEALIRAKGLFPYSLEKVKSGGQLPDSHDSAQPDYADPGELEPEAALPDLVTVS